MRAFARRVGGSLDSAPPQPPCPCASRRAGGRAAIGPLVANTRLRRADTVVFGWLTNWGLHAERGDLHDHARPVGLGVDWSADGLLYPGRPALDRRRVVAGGGHCRERPCPAPGPDPFDRPCRYGGWLVLDQQSHA